MGLQIQENDSADTLEIEEFNNSILVIADGTNYINKNSWEG